MTRRKQVVGIVSLTICIDLFFAYWEIKSSNIEFDKQKFMSVSKLLHFIYVCVNDILEIKYLNTHICNLWNKIKNFILYVNLTVEIIQLIWRKIYFILAPFLFLVWQDYTVHLATSQLLLCLSLVYLPYVFSVFGFKSSVKYRIRFGIRNLVSAL